MTKRLMSFSKCRSVEVINNPARPGSNHKEVNCINYSNTITTTIIVIIIVVVVVIIIIIIIIIINK